MVAWFGVDVEESPEVLVGLGWMSFRGRGVCRVVDGHEGPSAGWRKVIGRLDVGIGTGIEPTGEQGGQQCEK